MKTKEIQIGKTYEVSVSNKIVSVLVLPAIENFASAAGRGNTWRCQNRATEQEVLVKSAQFHHEVATVIRSGIYSITNSVNGKVYVGSSVFIDRRIKSHRGQLRKGNHRNGYLQASWNEHGEAAFQFAVLELCAIIPLGGVLCPPREKFWIDKFDSMKKSKGFNVAPPCLICFVRRLDELMDQNRLEEVMDL